MARTPARRAKSRTSATARRRPAPRPKATSASPGTGPVTLKQARALARLAVPLPKGGKAALVPASPASVGVERRKLALKQEQEKRRRIREYRATMAIMKKRGVKGLAPKRKKGAPAPKAPPKPLQVFAEGDSWFDYPVPFFGGGVIPRLEDKLGVPILNLAKAGDEVRYMLGVKERKELIAQFTSGCPAGGPWDVLLFSGGGNDIVDNPMALWIRDFNATLPPAALIHQGRLDAALALVRAGYEDLIGLRDRLSPQTHLVFHAYDFAIPDGRGICHLGPWLKPTFDLRGFPTQAAAFAVTKILLQQFATMLASLEAAHQKVTFINGQGTLAPATGSWHNELHPSKDGFKTFASLFHQKLKALFPTKVP
ncbi:MAG: hypothetical protein AB7H93_07880 [Vicinamibacterales bacterium]